MIFRMNAPTSPLVDGAHYWAKLPERRWAVWRFEGGLLVGDQGGGYRPDQFVLIGARVYTPEEADAQVDKELAKDLADRLDEVCVVPKQPNYGEIAPAHEVVIREASSFLRGLSGGAA